MTSLGISHPEATRCNSKVCASTHLIFTSKRQHSTTKMPGDKLTLLYFKGLRARGEAARILLAISGKPYEFQDITFDDWPAKKLEIPTGQLPSLYTEDGKYLPQSDAICRYLGRKFGFMGKGYWDESQNDAWMGNVSDVINDVPNIYGFMVFGRPKPDNGDTMIEDFKEKWDKLAALVKKHLNETGKKFLNSDKIQVADIWLMAATDFVDLAYPGAVEVNSDLKDLVDRIKSDPRIKKYLANRPDAKV